tara:strand:- start:225 stop:488 length:264 start_codon:yes stop_codon:yes gene_type:complete
MSNGRTKSDQDKKFTEAEVGYISKLSDYLRGGRTLSNHDKKLLQEWMKAQGWSPGKKRPSKTQSMKRGGKVKKYAHGGKVRSYNFIN